MPTLQDRLSDLATRAATECKSLRTLMNGNAATLTALTTTDKTNLVAAINEVRTSVVDAATISDGTTSSTTTWSSTKISGEISGAVSNLVASAPGTLDTLAELAAALGNDVNFATTMSTALGNRLRVDTAAQGLNGTQQSNARTNLGLGTAATATVQTSGADNTAGRVLALASSGNTGAFGLGGNFGPQLANLDAAVIPSGLYFFNTASGTTGTNPGFAAGAVLVLQGIGTGTNAPLMIAVERSSGAGRMAWRSSQGGTWGAWQTVCSLDAIGNPDTNFVAIFEAGLV